MKRFIAAVSFAALAVPAAAALYTCDAEVGLPYDQNLVDRALPNVAEQTVTETEFAFNGSAPYDQLTVDRALPELRVDRAEVASAGNTRSDVEISTEAANVSSGSGLATGPWANDYHFIAPAQ